MFFCPLYRDPTCQIHPATHRGLRTLPQYYDHLLLAHFIPEVNAPEPLVRPGRLGVLRDNVWRIPA